MAENHFICAQNKWLSISRGNIINTHTLQLDRSFENYNKSVVKKYYKFGPMMPHHTIINVSEAQREKKLTKKFFTKICN